MATNQNQSAPRTRTEGDVHDALEDVSALVLGDGGELGAELRRTFVAAGATVIAPRTDRPDAGEADDVVFIDTPSLDGDQTRRSEAEHLRTAIEDRVDRLDAVVTLQDGRWLGEDLTDVSMETWHRALRDGLTGPFARARALLPLLAETGSTASYTVLNSPLAELPTPAAGPAAVTAAGRRMLVQMLIQETVGETVRINEIVPFLPETTMPYTYRGSESVTVADAAAVAAALSTPASEVRGQLIRLRDSDDVNAWTEPPRREQR
jgi:NAD(P)-dependent dehydrogenase (short-subunit alcohol dehydrogenase family)